MAIARAAHIVGAISGTLGGTVFANSRQGLLVKHRPLKTNHRSTAQQTERSRHQRLIATWKTLTAAEYLQWWVMARQITTTNRLGVRTTITPLTLFFRQNRSRAYRSDPLFRTPHALTEAVPILLDPLVFTAGSTYSVTFNFPTGLPWAQAWTYGYRPFRTTPTRGVRSWKLLGRLLFVDAWATDIAAAWTAQLGALSAGEFVHLKFQVSTDGGLQNPPATATTTVLAP